MGRRHVIQKPIVTCAGQGAKLPKPALARSPGGTDHYLIGLHGHFHFWLEFRLLQPNLWNAHAARIANLDDLCFQDIRG